MRHLLIFISLIAVSGASAQSIDFGIEVQNNYNYVEKFANPDPYHSDALAVSVRDLNGDTSNIYFSKFSMENNFEIPLYFRFNLKKRWFFDLKLSNSVNTLKMEGVSNYNDSYYTSNYGTYDQFITDANANGFPDADSSDYDNYIGAARSINESEVRTTEKFKLLSYTFNAGVRLFPHKSVKMVMAAGFTFKFKYRKHLYNYIDFSNSGIQDIRSVESGLDWHAERSSYFNLMMGLELYRFRVSAFFQTGFSYTFPGQTLASEVTYAQDGTAFDVIRSYGFSLSANLFSMDIGRNVKKDEVSSDDVIISNIKKRRDKFDIGARYDRRGYNDMYTYYDDPTDRLNIMDVDTILYNNGGSYSQALDLEMITLGDIKRIQWGGRISGFMNVYLSDRWGLRGAIGGSQLVADIESTEFKATILQDSTGLNYVIGSGTPSVRRAAYRKTLFIVDLSSEVTYKVIDRDLFSLSLSAGVGISGMATIEVNQGAGEKGINELDLYSKFDSWHSGFGEKDFEIQQGEIYIDPANSPEQLFSDFDNASTEFELDPSFLRNGYGFLRFGVDANIERYTVGLGIDMSLRNMDRFLLSDYRSVYMSIGYKLWRR